MGGTRRCAAQPRKSIPTKRGEAEVVAEDKWAQSLFLSSPPSAFIPRPLPPPLTPPLFSYPPHSLTPSTVSAVGLPSSFAGSWRSGCGGQLSSTAATRTGEGWAGGGMSELCYSCVVCNLLGLVLPRACMASVVAPAVATTQESVLTRGCEATRGDTLCK